MSKKKTAKVEKKEWRWWTQSPEKLIKLQEAYVADATDEMAMVYAGVTRSQLYYYQKLHPEFTEWKKVLKNNPTVKAKMNVIKAIQEGKIAESQWWLERKARAEGFGNVSQTVTMNLTPEDTLSDEDRARLTQLLNGQGGA